MAKASKTGKVVSVKMKDTVIVETSERKSHPLYRKQVKKTKRFMAHTESQLKEGDIVKISLTRPLSAKKKWKVEGVIHGSK